MTLFNRKNRKDNRNIQEIESIDTVKKDKKKSVWSENKEILIILITFFLLFLAMIIYVTIFVYSDASRVINSSYNKRINILSNHVYRGEIRALDDSIIAKTVINDEGIEVREYPYGPLFAHAAGYASHGGLGIEGAYAFTLLTSNDDFLARVVNDFSGKKNWGNNIITTLDPIVSYAAYSALGDRRGAVVVSDVNSGEIIALISKPDFDPNNIDAYWDYYNNDNEASALLNRVTQGLYPPGSTFKIVTALEYIRENNNIDDYVFDCNGKFEYEDLTINCYHGNKHGVVDFEKSFAKSCNSSFANITLQLNKNKFKKTCNELLFNEELPLPYSYRKSSVNISSKTDISDILQAGIGQGKTQITPIHMNLITSAIANRGVLMTPYVVKSVESVNGEVIFENEESEYKRIMSGSEASELCELMRNVVIEGTATRLNNSDLYTAAGKTGSAEYSSDKTKSHAWFTGFAPADDPQIAVTVIVEGGGSGGETAVPIAKAVMDSYFTK